MVSYCNSAAEQFLKNQLFFFVFSKFSICSYLLATHSFIVAGESSQLAFILAQSLQSFVGYSPNNCSLFRFNISTLKKVEEGHI